MTIEEYQQLALRTLNPDADPVTVNCALGIAGEGGEICDIIKKQYFHGKTDAIKLKNKLRDEMGDLLWYVVVLAYDYGIHLDDIMEENIEKLRKRHPDSFQPYYTSDSVQ